jgi:hypothetical protein
VNASAVSGASVAHQADKIADKSTIMRDQEGSEGLQTETGTEVGGQAKESGEMQQEADKKVTGGDEEMENLEEAPGSQKDAWPEKVASISIHRLITLRTVKLCMAVRPNGLPSRGNMPARCPVSPARNLAAVRAWRQSGVHGG